jgi:hypothetical protein
MNYIIQLIKETLILIPALIITVSISKLILKHTFIGKIIAVVLKDIWLSVRLCFKTTKTIGKSTYKTSMKLNKYLTKKLKDKKSKDTKKKVVNGNVIDFKIVQQLRHKWNK